jgi:hypothetical protein
MQIRYTHKLFFKKYAYKVVLNCQTSGNRWCWRNQDTLPQEFQSLQDWCEQHAPGAYKIQRRYQGGTKRHSDWHQLVYLQSERMKDALVKDQSLAVQEVWQPLDADHFHQLDVRNVIEVRHQLIYRKYAHVIYFKYDRHGQLHEWLKALLADSTTSELKGDAWWCKVYSNDLDDVRMIQLSYGEQIDYVKHVKLIPPPQM